jgi:uncharacterized membrane protein
VIALINRWWAFVHLVGVFGFLLAHGTSVAVMFRVRKETDREKIRQLLQFSGSTIRMFYVSLAVLLAGGIGAGLQNHYFWQRWLTISIAVLVAVSLAMYFLARPYYRAINAATELRPSGVPRVSDEDLHQRLRSRRPTTVALLGFGGLLAILWLMIFKPL